MSKHKCADCGHIGIPVWIHNDDKCEKCYSSRVFEIVDEITSNKVNESEIITVSYAQNHITDLLEKAESILIKLENFVGQNTSEDLGKAIAILQCICPVDISQKMTIDKI